jgi:GNAT superfamily N-acetyltransferase
MVEIIRTTPDNPEFIQLIALLDKDIQHRDGEEYVFYAQFNKTDTIKNAIVIYNEKIAVGCGAFKFYKENIAEIKRIYVDPKMRGKGIASKILTELESWAKEENYKSCILETGQKYPEAIALYKKNGFAIIENYGQYENNTDSICFSKTLS